MPHRVDMFGTRDAESDTVLHNVSITPHFVKLAQILPVKSANYIVI